MVFVGPAGIYELCFFILPNYNVIFATHLNWKKASFSACVIRVIEYLAACVVLGKKSS